MEKFVTALFYKFFKDEYVVVRTARFDDIAKKIDMIIVNKKTGQVIGAFDAVVGDTESQRVKEKEQKTFATNCQDDGKLVYGIGVKDNKLVKLSRDSVPVMYLDLSRHELMKCISDIDLSKDGISTLEAKTMNEFLKSIGEQLDQVDIFKKFDADSDLRKTYNALQEKVANRTARKLGGNNNQNQF